MGHHNESITCVAHADINEYAIVKVVNNGALTDVHGMPMVTMCTDDTDIILGVAFQAVKAGELVTVRLPFSGLMPAYAYNSPKPGQGLTIGEFHPGALSNNTNPGYERKVAYVVQVGKAIGSTDISWCMVAFTRAYYI